METNVTIDAILSVLKSVFFLIPELIIIGIAIYYLIKKGQTTEGMLILIGSSITIITILTRTILFSFLYDSIMDTFEIVISVTQGLSFLGAILFAVGFFKLVQKVIKSNE